MYIDDPVKRLKKVRDLTLMAINNEQYLVIACDSDGGIGNKSHDVVKVPEEIIAQFAVRVPLFEIIASGAKPFMVIDCLSVEMDPIGEKMVYEMKRYVREVGIYEDVQFTGSSEENVPTIQTGVGVTVLGLVDQQRFPVGSSLLEDKVVCVGIPKSGPRYEIHPDDPEIVALRDLKRLREISYIRDIVPVGSKGLLYEANQLASSSGHSFHRHTNTTIDFEQSAGPSTCVLLATDQENIQEIIDLVQAPVTVIGDLIKL
ncbi:AIR synthase related protein [Salipaludibacillus sp. HK11]|uniref:AIR synthase related protein n=1 Tax=Salipaludibacillus sp. HK11 TaxID=3394320 RepID=UPI0039FD2527